MSQNLTQPEEVDRVLMEMSRQAMTAGISISDGGPASGITHRFECDWSIGSTDFSYGTRHNKSANGLSDS